ncbi:M23 family metallopeptidase [Novosphingobium sp.]|uniref:M23 family metallopeptidase n=1 Tax=Novosphingobium sp. TaxID=1874826 RepID=UPI00334126F8
MAFVGPDTALIEGRSFGRARPGQPGTRRVDVLRGTIDVVLPPPPPKPSLRDWPHPVARAWDRWCRKIETRLAGSELAIDLRAAPGALHRLGGTARLALLACPALLAWPAMTPFDASPVPLPDGAEQVELHAQAIRPFLAGATTGRHFAATNRVARVDSVPERATIALTAVLGENDDLARMLQRLGLGSGDATTVKALVAPLTGRDALMPGTRFAITLGPRAVAGDPRPLLQMAFRPRFDLNATVERRGGALALTTRPVPVDSTPLHLVGAAGASLYFAARAAGASPDTVQAYLQAVDQYLPLETIEPGDQFELVFAHKRAIGGAGDGNRDDTGQDGDLLYAGVLRQGKPLLQVMRWGNDGNFYTADALASAGGQGSGLMAAPVAGNITSWFGMRRHPILGFVRMHAGVDFAATYGSPIYAASDGVVSYAGWHGGHGNYVRLDHGGGIDTGYGHMSRIAVGAGARVSRGQVIGYVGSTGLSTGPHLHYELFRGGQPVDPLSIRFVPHHNAVSPTEIAGFQAKMRQLLAVPRAGGATGA